MSSIKDFDFNLTADAADEDPSRGSDERPIDPPFRIAVLGNFSGRAPDQATASSQELARRRFVRLDQDNFDALMAKMNVSLSLQLSGAKDDPPLKLSFAALDDFHPDRIFERVELFAKLKDTRKDLQQPQNSRLRLPKCAVGRGQQMRKRFLDPLNPLSKTRPLRCSRAAACSIKCWPQPRLVPQQRRCGKALTLRN
ncbi:MAG: type VI secretion system contractile sheath small subunit [Pyrinomonadaceae bacterium]